MNYYTSQIPLPLAEKLKEKGMPMMPCFNITQTGSFSDDGGIHFYYHPTFGACFDWLMSEKEIQIVLEPYWDIDSESVTGDWSSYVRDNINGLPRIASIVFVCPTWHEAAEKAIEKALTLI